MGRYILADGSMPCGFGQALELDAAAGLSLDDGVLGGALRLKCTPAALRARPHHTVSQSEAGFEKIMQSAELTLGWTLGAGDIVVVLEYQPHVRQAAGA
jgi:hypothetical protein